MKSRLLLGLLTVVLGSGVSSSSDPAPTAQQVVVRALAASGGADAFSKLGVLQIGIVEEENLRDGTRKSSETKAFVSTNGLDTMRLELQGDVVVVRNGVTGWATIEGKVDKRPQTPRMAFGTTNQKLVPLLMPFSLSMTDVVIREVEKTSFDATPAYRLTVEFPKDFFTSPIMNTTWHVFVSEGDGKVLAAEFQPPPEFAKVQNEGVRYRYLRHKSVEGVELVAEALLDGIDANGVENGHTRIVRLTPSVRGRWEPALFIHPDKLEAIENADMADE